VDSIHSVAHGQVPGQVGADVVPLHEVAGGARHDLQPGMGIARNEVAGAGQSSADPVGIGSKDANAGHQIAQALSAGDIGANQVARHHVADAVGD